MGLAVAIDDALDYLTGLIPELGGVLVVVTDAYQARLAEIAAQYLRFTAISGDSAVLSRKSIQVGLILDVRPCHAQVAQQRGFRPVTPWGRHAQGRSASIARTNHRAHHRDAEAR